MRSAPTLVALVVASTASASVSLGLQKKLPGLAANGQHLSAGIRKLWATGDSSTSALLKKRSTLNLEAENVAEEGGYFGTIEVGTPGQELVLHLDTGSSDTWVNSVKSSICSSSNIKLCDGFFNPDASNTYVTAVRGGFDIAYVDGTEVRGDYFNDTLTLDGQEIPAQQLGLATSSVDITGIMGLGLSIGVSTEQKYPTILDNMVSSGLIGRQSFSLYLNDQESSTGSVLFGGLDTQKFIGSLTTLPLIDGELAQGDIFFYAVNLSAVGIADLENGGSTISERTSETDLTAVLDSGSTLSLMRDDIVRTAGDAFGVVEVDGIYLIDCQYNGPKGEKAAVEFKFGSSIIRVPGEELVVDIPDESQSQIKRIVTEVDWDRICLFGLQGGALFGIEVGNLALLGDTVLRSAYIVYDTANHQLGIAQANLNSTDSNIVELKANETSLPDVTGVAAQISSPSDSSDGGSSNEGSGDEDAGARPSPQLSGVVGVAMASTFFMVMGGMVAFT